MAAEPERVVVVGGGVAGLTYALEAARRGSRVTLLEREAQVGGLARSLRHGAFTFDLGPHRVHTYDPAVERLVGAVLDGDVREIGRRSGVWMFGRYREWPLTPWALVGLPPRVLLGIARDLVLPRSRPGPSFRDLVLARYGATLYEVFFRPFTERFTGTACADLARDWGETSIERALIDRGIEATDLASLAWSTLRPRRPLRFLYPASGGIGVLAERLAAQARAAGAEIRTAAVVDGLEVQGGRVTAARAAGEALPCGRLVWTGPLPRLAELLGTTAADLQYLALVVYCFRVAEPPATPYQWCYFSDAAVPFSRVSLPLRFNASLAPPAQTGLCVEVPARVGDPVWRDPEAAARGIAGGLRRVGLVRDERAIAGFEAVRVAEAYPLYTLGYDAAVTRAREAVRVRAANVELLGRQASFWYNNMDHSMGEALGMARHHAGAG